jgi:hypothetical protein
MNDIRISVTLSLDEKYPEDGYIDFNLSVDGQYLHEVGVYVDPVDLVTSATMSESSSSTPATAATRPARASTTG